DGIDGFTDAVTDDAGHYQLAGPAGSVLKLATDAAGHAYTIQTVTLPASGTTTLNLPLGPGLSFAGAVRDGVTAGPLVSAVVALRNQAGPSEGYTVLTNAQGRFLLTTLPAGTYDVIVASPGHQTSVLRGLVISGTGAVQDFSLDASSISLSGRV